MAVENRITLDQINGEEFIKRLKGQDAQAFDQLFDSLLPKLVGFLSIEFYQIDELDLEEIAADVLLKVYNTIPKFDINGKAKLTTWIFKIAINATIDHFRRIMALAEKAEFITNTTLFKEYDREKGSTAIDRYAKQQWDADQKAVGPLDGFITIEEKVEAMSRALASLDEVDQNVLRLKLVMDYDQIAEKEQSKPGTLRVRHKRALQKLEAAYLKEFTNDGRENGEAIEADVALEV